MGKLKTTKKVEELQKSKIPVPKNGKELDIGLIRELEEKGLIKKKGYSFPMKDTLERYVYENSNMGRYGRKSNDV